MVGWTWLGRCLVSGEVGLVLCKVYRRQDVLMRTQLASAIYCRPIIKSYIDIRNLDVFSIGYLTRSLFRLILDHNMCVGLRVYKY